MQNLNPFKGSLLHSSWEADDWKQQPIHTEVLQHALNWLSIDPERDAGCTKVKTTTNDIILP